MDYKKHKRKEKITPVYKYQLEYEPVDRALITIFHDAVYNAMPPLGDGLWWDTSKPNLLRRGDGCLFVV